MYRLAAERLPRWREWGIFTEQEIARMEEVELTSELALLMVRGSLSGRDQKALNNIYRDNEESFPGDKDLARRFRFIMDSVDEKLGDSLSETAFTRKTLAYPLLAATYDLHYGIGSKLVKDSPKRIPAATLRWIGEAGRKIKDRDAPEELLEQISRRTTHSATRSALVKYLTNPQ